MAKQIVDIIQKVGDEYLRAGTYIEKRVETLEEKCVSATFDKEGFVKLYDGAEVLELAPDNVVLSAKDTVDKLNEMAEQIQNGVEGLVDPATETPLADSQVGFVGNSLKYAREDHVHPLSDELTNFISSSLDIPHIKGSIDEITEDDPDGLYYVEDATSAGIINIIQTISNREIDLMWG